jgi:hypothetical protein
VQEIYENLEDVVEHSTSVKSQNQGVNVVSKKLTGSKRSAAHDLNVSEDKPDEYSDDESENEETKVKR